jgi:hypothetical protein
MCGPSLWDTLKAPQLQNHHVVAKVILPQFKFLFVQSTPPTSLYDCSWECSLINFQLAILHLRLFPRKAKIPPSLDPFPVCTLFRRFLKLTGSNMLSLSTSVTCSRSSRHYVLGWENTDFKGLVV